MQTVHPPFVSEPDQEPSWSLETCIAIARAAHSGQTDKLGVEYIRHPATVAAYVAGSMDAISAEQRAIAVQAAWLHDVVEDTKVTRTMLEQLGCPLDVLEIVDLLTHEPGRPNIEYWADIAKHPLAKIVKRADVAHNMHPSRMAGLDEATRVRLIVKYRRALQALS